MTCTSTRTSAHAHPHIHVHPHVTMYTHMYMQLYPSDHLPLGIVVSLGENIAEVGSIDLPSIPYVLPNDENDNPNSEGIQVLSKE